MGTRRRVIEHTFAGGLATDLGSTALLSAESRLELQYLLRADNIFFSLQGGIRKIGGTTRYNSSALESGADIRGMFEYVRQGTSGAPTRKRVVTAGTTIKKDDNDSSFANIFTGMNNGTVPCYTVFEDLLILTTDGDEAPRKWDQTTADVLGGSPPNFAFTIVHANRLWGAGDPAAPSLLYYSSLLEPEEWEGVGDSGSLDIDSNDGDQITGLGVKNGELIVFKGRAFGSVHRIAGLTPSTFSRTVLSRGFGAACHNAIFTFGDDDLGFLAQDGTIRTLRPTEAFGDYRTPNIAREIEQLLSTITFSSIHKSQAVTDLAKGYTLFALPVNTSTVPNLLLMMDTRFQRPRFATWTAIDAVSLARMSDASASNQLIIYAGGGDGFLRKLQQPTRSIDETVEINAIAQTPFLEYDGALYKKTLRGVGLTIQPKGNYGITMGYMTDEISSSVELEQTGGTPLGEFILDVDTLGGQPAQHLWAEVFDGIPCRSVSFQISNGSLEEDFEIQKMHAVFETAQSESYE